MDTTTQHDDGADDGGGVDLSGLIAEAEGLEVAQGAAQAEAEAKAAESTIEANRQGLREALAMARMVASPAFRWWEDFGACWSDGQLDAIADAGAQIMQRHQITMGELLSQYGPYVALAGATIPPGLATYTAIKARKAEQARPRANEGLRLVQPAPAQQPLADDGRQR